jgi:glycosyltransferase involved in cell wall biosynthesis
VPFTLAGRVDDEAAAAQLEGAAKLVGWVDDDELARLYATSAAYVQASRHEGFGMAVAEAMLAGSIPVVTRVGALPEVVGDAGIIVDDMSPATIAAAIATATAASADARQAARTRILTEFPIEARERAVQAEVIAALGWIRTPSRE